MEKLGELSKDELLARLEAHVGTGHVWQAGLIAYLAEVEERRLHLELASSSMFDFCVRRLGMSEGEAHRRLIAARLVRAFPSVLGYLERGEVHLCALGALREHLTEENHEELLRAATRKTTRAVQEMLAARFPRPDVPARIECLEPQAALPIAPPAPPDAGGGAETTKPTPRAEVRPQVEPLSAARYRVELTVSEDVKAKLDRIKDLMRHRNPSGDLEVIMESALELLLAKLEKERLGKTARPRTRKPAEAEAARESRHVPAEVRREVFKRDGEQCTFVAADGQRCTCRTLLELDHVIPHARGGTTEAGNLRVRCRAHNRLHAEQTFGRAHVEERIHFRQRKYDVGSGPLEAAARGLLNLGFREAEVRRVLALVEAKVDASIAGVDVILRAALVLLT